MPRLTPCLPCLFQGETQPRHRFPNAAFLEASHLPGEICSWTKGRFFFWGGADYRPQYHYPNIIWYNCVSGNVGKVWERNDKLWNLVRKCWDTPNWSTGVGSSNIHHLQRKQCCNEKRKQSSGQFFLKSNFLGCPKDLPEVVALHQCKSVTSHYSKTQRLKDLQHVLIITCVPSCVQPKSFSLSHFLQLIEQLIGKGCKGMNAMLGSHDEAKRQRNYGNILMETLK